MSCKSPLTGGEAYIYDGSIEGFYCCVFESVYSREIPVSIQPEKDSQPTLFCEKYIISDSKKAERVKRSIPEKISPDALELVETVFLSCMDEKELSILRFLLLGYKEGYKVMHMLGHPDVSPLMKAEKHLQNEAHLLCGFVRFSDYGGVLASTITPKNFILPFISQHFTSRFSGEDFLIFDKTHKAALVYQQGNTQIIPLDNIQFPEADETEENFRALWKQFYNTIAIEARINPRCRMTHMPKRYWSNMLEVKDLV